MELIVLIILYFGYNLVVALIKKMQNQYEEPDFPYQPADKSPDSIEKRPTSTKLDGSDLLKRDRPNEKIEETLEGANPTGQKKNLSQQERYEELFKDEEINMKEIEAKKEEARRKKARAKKKLKKVKKKRESTKYKKNQEIDINNLGRQQLEQGVVLAEVLKPPRAKRPYRFKLNRNE
ncbi:MAG: hypothetical protein AWU54_1740 [Candidatus Frackibacter sp. T328-2]|nr:MAG: hypothetical protein AWU54_1740 [Candidatus Frackibacter sp. T328-2]